MIRYALSCAKGHDFDSWFQSADAYDRLKAAGQITCPDCGSGKVEKALMAPGLAISQDGSPLSKPPVSKREQALAELRKKVEEGSDYVGMNFVSEARAIHDGDAPERSIWGEARVDEAAKLIEDGIPVAPLPFRPKSKSN